MPRSTLGLVVFLACAPSAVAEPVRDIPLPTDAERVAYWNQGRGEVTSYRLEQARYGELHDGHAVLVFVTEPFSRSKKVKLDAPSRSPEDRVDVLKLNQVRKFETGIYPYSTMTSVFTPVDGGRALKVSATTQEWCGHVFAQLTQGDDGAYSGHPARGRLDRVDAGTLAYELQNTTVDRALRIEFEDHFPFRILRWTETHPSGWGAARKRLTTTAERTESMLTDYWNRHRNADRAPRDPLGL